jgi:hypothetical protein
VDSTIKRVYNFAKKSLKNLDNVHGIEHTKTAVAFAELLAKKKPIKS